MPSSVSICMATWNGAKFLAEQLETVVPQLDFGDEVVVVDDASSDQTMEMLQRAAGESRAAAIRIQQNPQNLGPVRTFERALEMARGEIVMLCDQDDRWMPGKIARIRKIFDEDADVTLVMSDAELIDDAGDVIVPSRALVKPFREGLVPNMLVNRYLGCAMAFRRASLGYCLPFPEGIPMHDQWIGVLHNIFGKVVYLKEPLIQYRRHVGNATADTHASWITMIRWRLNLTGNLVGRWWKSRGAASAHRPNGRQSQ